MRTWGRVPATSANYLGDPSLLIRNEMFPDGYVWQEVTTDANGYNDAVWLTTLAQVLQLNLNESPFYGNYGIPAQQAVASQIPPDYYATLMQQAFSPFFVALVLSKNKGSVDPSYAINATPNPGAIMLNPVPV